jgi:hypothetical protein
MSQEMKHSRPNSGAHDLTEVLAQDRRRAEAHLYRKVLD